MWRQLDPPAQEQVPAKGATDSAFAAASSKSATVDEAARRCLPLMLGRLGAHG